MDTSLSSHNSHSAPVVDRDMQSHGETEASNPASPSDDAEMTANSSLEATVDAEPEEQAISTSEDVNGDIEEASTSRPQAEEPPAQSQLQPAHLQQPPLNYHQRDDPSQELPLAVPVPEPPAISSHHHEGLNHTSHHTSAQRSTASAASSNISGLIHEFAATGGQEESPADVVQAQPLDEWKDDKDRPCLLSPTQWAIGGLLLVVLIVVGVVAGVTQASSGGDSNGSANNMDGTNSTGDAETLAPTTANTNTNSNNMNENTNSTLEDLGPTFPNYPPFSNNLHFLTSTALENPSSPQAWANTWMMEDPNLETYSEQRKLQRFSLATLYYSTRGDNWARNDLWLDYEQNECFWYNQYTTDATTAGTVAADAVSSTGVSETCDENSQILHLNLANNYLIGVLPVELFFFPALASLDLSYNGLEGTAPTMFAGARLLQRLVLSSNQLTGQFTAELGFVASELRILHNDGNQFTGAVPGLLRLLPNLVDLNITGNQYTGSLPPSLSQLSDTLTSFQVADNQITGSIPSQLGLATRLRVFDVGENRDLRGSIPTEIGALTDLAILDIDNTGIVGVIPDEVCTLQQSGQLELDADCEVSIDCCL